MVGHEEAANYPFESCPFGRFHRFGKNRVFQKSGPKIAPANDGDRSKETNPFSRCLFEYLAYA